MNPASGQGFGRRAAGCGLAGNRERAHISTVPADPDAGSRAGTAVGGGYATWCGTIPAHPPVTI
jgi:hypothetical protein